MSWQILANSKNIFYTISTGLPLLNETKQIKLKGAWQCFIEKKAPDLKTYPYNVVKVADFPLKGKFYNKKFSILISKIE